MNDLISRQAAIDAVKDAIIKAEWEYAKNAIKQLPSAQPEIIRCKDCKYHGYEHYKDEETPYCSRIDYGYGWRDNDYCSRAERREE